MWRTATIAALMTLALAISPSSVSAEQGNAAAATRLEPVATDFSAYRYRRGYWRPYGYRRAYYGRSYYYRPYRYRAASYYYPYSYAAYYPRPYYHRPFYRPYLGVGFPFGFGLGFGAGFGW